MPTFTQTDAAVPPVTHVMETDVGDTGAPREIARVALRAVVETNIAAAATQLAAIANSVDGLEGFTDGVEGLLTTLRDTLTAQAAFVDGLETLIGSTNAALSVLDGHVDGLEGFTDGIETLLGTLSTALTALNGNVDGLETLVTATNAALTTLQGYVDGLEGFTDGVEGKLDTLHTDLVPPVSHIGQTAVGASSTSLGTQACPLGVWVKNISPGTQKVYVSDTTATTSNGYELVVGEERFFPCTNISAYNIIASAASGKVCWEAT